MSKDPKPAVTRDSDKFMLRLPDGMRDRIAESAKRHGRSMNAEIVNTLHNHYQEQDIHDRIAKEEHESVEVEHLIPKKLLNETFDAKLFNLVVATREENTRIRSLMEQQLDLLEHIVSSNVEQRHNLADVTLPPAPPDKPKLKLPARKPKA